MIRTTIKETPHGELLIGRHDDVGDHLEHNKAVLAEGGDGYGPTREWRRAASIPLIVAESWKANLGVDIFNPDHTKKVNELLNSSEWMFLRTAPGRL
jgi:hypothetical protein